MALSKRKATLLASLLVASAVAGSALWYGRLTSFPIRFKLAAETVDLRLRDPAAGLDPRNDVSIATLRTFGETRISAIPDIAGLGSEDLALAGPTTLSAVNFPGAQSVRLSSPAPGCAELSATPSFVRMRVQGEQVALHQGARRWRTAAELVIEAQSIQFCFGSRAQLWVYDLTELLVTENVEPAPGAATLVSTLKSASVASPRADRTLNLEEGESLLLSNFTGVGVLELRKSAREGEPNLVQMIGNGTAAGLKTGMPGTEQDMRPRWIEFLKARDALGGLVAAIVACWGIGWGVVSFLEKQK